MKVSKATKKALSVCMSMLLTVNTCSAMNLIAADNESTELPTELSTAASDTTTTTTMAVSTTASATTTLTAATEAPATTTASALETESEETTTTSAVTTEATAMAELKLNSKIEDNKVTLTWNKVSDEDGFGYQLFRREDGSDWEVRSIWNEKEKVDVLNIYPAQPFLEEWMTSPIGETETPAGKDLMNISSVYFDDFNSDPATYLYNEDGSWKYDVLFVGAADYNSGFDFSNEAAEEVTKFEKSGRGVLFGHDTLGAGLGYTYFNTFAEDLGILIGARNTSASNIATVVKTGVMTDYPWTIRGTLDIPSCHTTGQYALDATVWMTLGTGDIIDAETGAIGNFYLITNNNLGMIQTGHSNGQATDDERKVLANTLFFLYQNSDSTNAVDGAFTDRKAPQKPDVSDSNVDQGKILLSVHAKDEPTVYEYYVSAVSEKESKVVSSSNIVQEESLSGIAGFVVKVTDSDKETPEIIEYEDDKETVKNIIPADEEGKAEFEVELDDTVISQYVHIFAVDNENNISEELIVPVNDYVKLGDVNFDGEVNAVDASLILAEYARISTKQPAAFTEKQFVAGEVDGNGIIDAGDASLVLVYYSYLSTGGELDDMRDWLKIVDFSAIKEKLAE